jgi:hypothetical protein
MEWTEGQDATARSLTRCEQMIERLAEPVPAHVLEARLKTRRYSACSQRLSGRKTSCRRSSVDAGKPNAVGTLDWDLVGHDRIVHHSIERNIERI